MGKILSFEEKKVLWNDNKIPHKGDKRREAKRRQRRIELNKERLMNPQNMGYKLPDLYKEIFESGPNKPKK